MAQENYVPFTSRPASEPVLPCRQTPSHQLSGYGAPEGVVPGISGQTYVDLGNNDLYLKIEGTQRLGWQLVGKVNPGGGGNGSSGSTNIFTATSDPNGVIQATGPAICFGSGAVDRSVWIKSTTGTSSTEWVLIISA